MGVVTSGTGTGETQVVRVRYWASAKSAAGVASDELPVDGPITLAEVLSRAVALHPGSGLSDVLRVCSTLLGGQHLPVAVARDALGADRQHVALDVEVDALHGDPGQVELDDEAVTLAPG